MKVLISDYAKQQLQLIFSYYVEVASHSIAKNIIVEISNSFQLLEKFPEAGQPDEFMKHHKKEYRRLVSGNYKIIYCIRENEVHISDVFDSRQNPEKQHS
ncbi:MAG: type II toxin-antitoxin system RelE/ParE family toxin [Sphingobacteriales bacterium]|nr:MAG: type II toxin-antitoxin system RelE/ParE family toxin [Sphingobacteriales bacterium]